jgi:Cys-tRNA synthase (O-phospho-L-seryl-tRNA:Cys-tRNA synthase)
MIIVGILKGVNNSKIHIEVNEGHPKEYKININKYKEVVIDLVNNNIGKKAVLSVTPKKYKFMGLNGMIQGTSLILKTIDVEE